MASEWFGSGLLAHPGHSIDDRGYTEDWGSRGRETPKCFFKIVEHFPKPMGGKPFLRSEPARQAEAASQRVILGDMRKQEGRLFGIFAANMVVADTILTGHARIKIYEDVEDALSRHVQVIPNFACKP
jgi:hypothetical protein